MFQVDGEEQLTVYNGEEDRSVPGGIEKDLVPEDCCSKVEGGRSDCAFKGNCIDEVKLLHRALILGEPIKKSLTENVPLLEVLNEWTPANLMVLLNTASRLIEGVKSADFFESKAEKEEGDLYLALILIRTFIQLNYTGPDFDNEELVSSLMDFKSACSADGVDVIIKDCLEVDGIEMNPGVVAPALLLLAKHFLSSLKRESSLWPFITIWKFRVDYLHQKILSRRSWTLSRRIKFYADRYVDWMQCHEMNGALVQVHASMLCEMSEMLVHYYDGILSERFLEEAMKTLGITVVLTGKMGYRTKFQQTPTPQAVVNVSITEKGSEVGIREAEDSALAALIAKSLPVSVALNDDTRLEQIRLVDEEEVKPHTGIEQLVLSGTMVHKLGFGFNQELDRKEIEALVQVMLANPVSWSGRVCALVSRCKLEKGDRRAVERTRCQLEELLRSTANQKPEEENALLRQYLFFGSAYFSRADMHMLYGEVLLSLEHWREALEIYNDLGSFEQIVRCYEKMNLRHRGEELVEEKIKNEGKSPKLLILLGDLGTDISYYHEAWTLSGGKSYLAQQRLGEHYFNRGLFAQAADHLQLAVDLAPLEYPLWLKLAWACYKTEDYETAFQAYLRAANLEYDNYQVWNNLANCALKLDRKEYALRAYRLACKCNYDEWRVWSNILVVASELKYLNESVNAYHRILDLHKGFMDESSLELVVEVAINQDNISSGVLANVARLLGRVTSGSTRSTKAWILYGRLLATFLQCDPKECDDATRASNYERGMRFYDKGLTLMRQTPSWKTDLTILKSVVSGIIEYRMQRERGIEKLDAEVNQRLKGLDNLLKQTAKSVHDTLKEIVDSAPNPLHVMPLLEQMAEEVKDPFYQ